ncbi:TetR/AcrR family transcriptional regulator [Solicola gregarius]|uniref:TetR/AcrR family transcriptional regulator n=2 Tax=Solicola gregarius TaxID=2908642 RepID=A0AA46TI99_9ACTN|nr:TetR/AcrR family transcriptional regulator [Solicola gregarius]
MLTEQPGRVPSTRALYESAGVAAPTLYHHFGDKDGLLQAVTEEAFAEYLERKRTVPRSGDLLVDFAAGWDMHVGFGVENPALYALMYGNAAHQSPAAQTAEAELRRGLERLADAGLLCMGVDEAIAITTAMAIGCVTRLIHDGGSTTGPLAERMRAALMSELTGRPPELGSSEHAAALLLAQLGSATALFTSAEEALLRQWLRTLIERVTPAQDAPEQGAKK